MSRPFSFWKLGLAVAGLVLLGAAPNANAALILAFSQNGATNTVTATNVGGTTTTLSINASVHISFVDGGSPADATFLLSATSIPTATNVGGAITQHFTGGTFSITSGATNFLSGTFTDVVAGNAGANSATLSSGTGAGNTLTFTSNVIPGADLGLDHAMALSFSNLLLSLGITGTSISSFTAGVSGNFSANIVTPVVPEPATLVGGLIGVSCLGLAKLRRRKAAAAV
jgi:hypothetical protein